MSSKCAGDIVVVPADIATCMYYAGIDPFTNKPVNTAKNLRNRKLQRALMQFFKPENYFELRKALTQAGRGDLIGGCDGLIPANPPKEAIEARRNRPDDPDHYHSVANPAKNEKPGERSKPALAKNRGYRPGGKTQARRQKPGRDHSRDFFRMGGGFASRVRSRPFNRLDAPGPHPASKTRRLSPRYAGRGQNHTLLSSLGRGPR